MIDGRMTMIRQGITKTNRELEKSGQIQRKIRRIQDEFCELQPSIRNSRNDVDGSVCKLRGRNHCPFERRQDPVVLDIIRSRLNMIRTKLEMMHAALEIVRAVLAMIWVGQDSIRASSRRYTVDLSHSPSVPSVPSGRLMPNFSRRYCSVRKVRPKSFAALVML